MAHWLDLALIGDEAALVQAIDALNGDQQNDVLTSLGSVLNLTQDEIVCGLIRLLVERARPLALPARLWERDVTSSDDPREIVRKHWASKTIPATPKRVLAAMELYSQFVQERKPAPVTEVDLERSGFRCRHCGMAFCNEQLEPKGIVSPHGNRGKVKRDARKPHWNTAEVSMRAPTHDHIWPISTYGDNSPANLQVLCGGCNLGKEDTLALQQVKAWTGLLQRKSLLGSPVVDWLSFYAQLRHAPNCAVSGRGPAETELTVELIDFDAPPVLGNLRTIESPGI